MSSPDMYAVIEHQQTGHSDRIPHYETWAILTDISRDQGLFGLMATGWPHSLFPIQGIPDHISLITEMELEDKTGCRHSWLTLSELEDVRKRYEEIYHATPPLDFLAIMAAMRTLDENTEGCSRLVFWFDG